MTSFQFLFHLLFFAIVKGKNYYVIPGSSVIIECPLSRGFLPGDSSLSWNGPQSTDVLSRDGQLNPNLPLNLRERLAIVGNHTSGQYNIQVSAVRLGDNGTYTCMTVKNMEFFSNSSVLHFLEAPSALIVHDVLPNDRILGIEETDLNIICTAIGGTPPPEVTLNLGGVILAVGTQIVQHVFKHISRSFDLVRLRCQTNNSVLTSPLQREFQIYLHLKPLMPTFSPNPITTEETQPLVVTCTSHGSRPAATIQWIIENAAITTGYTTESTHNTSDDTYIVTSILERSVDKTFNGISITCKVINVATADGVQISAKLDVKFAPDITVHNVTYHQSTANRTVICIPVGNPAKYTYNRWQQKSQYGELIRELDGGQDGVLTLPSVNADVEYQDSGEYVCTAGNGIKSRNGKIQQTGSGYVGVIGRPIFINANMAIQYSEVGKDMNMNVYVYSFPKYTRLTWYKSKTPVMQNEKYTLSETAVVVNDTFHGTKVQIEVYRVTLTIKSMMESDFSVTYKIELSNGIDNFVEYSILPQPASSPQIPAKCKAIVSLDTSIIIQWEPGHNGGYEQHFVVEYRVRGSMSWLKTRISDALLSGTQFYILTGLQLDTLYEFRMYAENILNRSLATSTEAIRTSNTGGKLSSLESIIRGVAGGLSTVIVIQFVTIIFLIIVRRQGKGFRRSKSKRRSEKTSYHNPIECTGTEETTNIYSQKVLEKTNSPLQEYETLGMKDIPNTYSEILNQQVTQKTISPLLEYERLGMKDTPNTYSELLHQQDTMSPESDAVYYEPLTNLGK